VQLYALIVHKSKRNLADLAENIYGIATCLMIASECLGFVNWVLQRNMSKRQFNWRLRGLLLPRYWWLSCWSATRLH